MRHPHPVQLINPAAGGTNQRTGNRTGGTADPVDTRGLLQQRDVDEPAADGAQHTEDRWWLWLPVGSPVTARTVVLAPQGRFEVDGSPITHDDTAGRARAMQVALIRTSDLQEAP